jgi:hypothetical protein
MAAANTLPPVAPAHSSGAKTAMRVPVDARPQAEAVARQRALMSRQVLEHAQLQDKHQQERSTLPPGKTSPSMQQRQGAETEKMETRHSTENRSPHPAPPHGPPPSPPPAKTGDGAKPPAR